MTAQLVFHLESTAVSPAEGGWRYVQADRLRMYVLGGSSSVEHGGLVLPAIARRHQERRAAVAAQELNDLFAGATSHSGEWVPDSDVQRRNQANTMATLGRQQSIFRD
jgi:hypothetical protein